MIATANDARFWDGMARRYAAHPVRDIEGYERTVTRVRDLLTKTDIALEIGCGTGTTALKLAPSLAYLTATDVSGEMIAIAREKATMTRHANVDFEIANVHTAPPVDGGYDAVLAFNVLHLLADLPAALAAIGRLLKPGGLLISKTPCLSEMNPLIRLAVPVARWLGKAPSVTFFTGAELEEAMTRGGLTVVERARHGSGKRDPRVFLVARSPASPDAGSGLSGNGDGRSFGA